MFVYFTLWLFMASVWLTVYFQGVTPCTCSIQTNSCFQPVNRSVSIYMGIYPPLQCQSPSGSVVRASD